MRNLCQITLNLDSVIQEEMSFKDIYLELWLPLCLVEQKHLCNFGRAKLVGQHLCNFGRAKLVGPKKENVLFPVTLPSLIFSGLLKIF